jgi:hypothetical protein
MESMPPVPQAGSRSLLMIRGFVQFGLVGEEEVDHEPDDLARGEVFAGGLVGELGELPERFLVEVAHLELDTLSGCRSMSRDLDCTR